MRFRRPSRNLFLPPTLAALALLTAACGEKPVAQVTHESDAIEIIDLLKGEGFDVSKEEVGEGASRKWSVEVSESLFGDESARAMQVLRYHGLPRPEEKGLEGAYDDQGMFPSESAQRAQRLKELKTEVERQLRLLPGVTRVNVGIVLPEDSALVLNPYSATASVLIIHKDPKPNFNAEQLQNLVARGVPNLKPENVSVMMTQQPPLPAPRQDGSARFMQTVLPVVVTVLVAVAGVFGWLWWREHSRRKKAESASSEVAASAESDGESDGAALDAALLAEELPVAEASAARRRLSEPGKTGAAPGGQGRRAV